MEVTGHHNRTAGRDYYEINIGGEAARELAEGATVTVIGAANGTFTIRLEHTNNKQRFAGISLAQLKKERKRAWFGWWKAKLRQLYDPVKLGGIAASMSVLYLFYRTISFALQGPGPQAFVISKLPELFWHWSTFIPLALIFIGRVWKGERVRAGKSQEQESWEIITQLDTEIRHREEIEFKGDGRTSQ
ncbi:hypothetical protein MO867_21040 [Microbulbifer sp. OS29]|uniref:Uncharacterized protein n=1 Tax=Microbulbifer okhotskensis TaxID=2926617 RepID=A0A9X2ER22_9GAMM|nr:hypothetical protein [Microbulbifer okhotskensis]MCO1336817.1 hypothetical protein [Microbulbifer okhotskensis]